MPERKQTVYERVECTIRERKMADGETPVLLMVSGGSDSTSLAYLAVQLRDAHVIGPLAMLHVNHGLRGRASDDDAVFVRRLAEVLGIPFFLCEIDVASIVEDTGGNMEAVARHERYLAAHEALKSLCLDAEAPISAGRIFTAHTQDDRVENFYMRSIVGTGPGGFRSMRYDNGPVRRPCLDTGRQDLRDYLMQRAADAEKGIGMPSVRDESGGLWREDATNAHTDRFRAYVRHEIVPRAKERNPQLLDVLCRTMNLIADEDDMLDAQAQGIIETEVVWLSSDGEGKTDYASGCHIEPAFASHPVPIQRRVAGKVLQLVLGPEARVETSSIEVVTGGFTDTAPISGYTGNIQGDLAVSANKTGLRIEPMATYRNRRKRQ